eukprot:TRINITY_DN2945_c0_g1_i1.p1 TRINITY_DN2945_c0_g1~~TRINITY_DN2945_c0_g1_i1.p1  ORF type:complete len:398 (+),score=36.06 TRINITY_DN2945_c0_g1_i1:98-1291(+)
MAATLPPISPGWTTHESSTHPGKFYQYNNSTGQTRWTSGSGNAGGRLGNSGNGAPSPSATKGRGISAADASPAATQSPDMTGPMEERITTVIPAKGGPSYSFSPGGAKSTRHGGRDAGITNQEWADPAAKAFYEKGKHAEHRMFYSQSECGDCCGHEPECMCTICVCGNHRCPPVLRHIPYPNLKSEYRKKYPGWDRFPDKVRPKHRGPFNPAPVPGMYDRRQWATPDGQTRARPLPDGGRPQLPFEGQTEYKDAFVPKRPDDPTATSPERTLDPVPFAGTTEHRAAFQGDAADPAKPILPSDPPFETGPFKGDTEHRTRYLGRQGDGARKGRPAADPWKKGPPRDLSTSYQGDYLPHRGQLCPARLLARKKPGQDDHMHYHFTGQFNQLGDPLYNS